MTSLRSEVPDVGVVFTQCEIVWATLAVGVHVLGWLSLHLRVEIRPDAQNGRYINPVIAFWQNETTLCAYQEHAQLRFRKEGYWFVGISWFTCMLYAHGESLGSLKLKSNFLRHLLVVSNTLTCLQQFSTSHILPTVRLCSAVFCSSTREMLC